MLWRRLHLIYTIWRPQLLFFYTGDASLQSHGHCCPIAFQCCTVGFPAQRSALVLGLCCIGGSLCCILGLCYGDEVEAVIVIADIVTSIFTCIYLYCLSILKFKHYQVFLYPSVHKIQQTIECLLYCNAFFFHLISLSFFVGLGCGFVTWKSMLSAATSKWLWLKSCTLFSIYSLLIYCLFRVTALCNILVCHGIFLQKVLGQL